MNIVGIGGVGQNALFLHEQQGKILFRSAKNKKKVLTRTPSTNYTRQTFLYAFQSHLGNREI